MVMPSTVPDDLKEVEGSPETGHIAVIQTIAQAMRDTKT